ncbi:MAG: PorT family protein [Bacteroidales bacterium]|nr:PorT family protein [Bacteroidales bacterium]
MKKIVLTLSLLLCGLALQAQPDFSALRYGVRAGLGIGSLDASYDDTDLQTMGGFSFEGGAFAELPLAKSLSVSAELDIEHTSVSDVAKSMAVVGSGLAGAQVLTTTKTQFPMNFIHIPVVARFCFLKNGLLYLEAGPQFGFLVGKVNTHVESEVTTIPSVGPSSVTKNTVDSDDTDNFKKAHVSFALGWGVNFKRFSLGVRVGLGLGDLQAEGHEAPGCNRVSHTDARLGLRYYLK